MTIAQAVTDKGLQTCFDAFAKVARQYEDADFLDIPRQATASYSSSGVTLTYSQAFEKIAQLAEEYAQTGLGARDQLALVLENRAEFFLHFLALNAIGVCVVPVHAELTSAEMSYLLEHSDSLAAIALAEHVPKVDRAVAAMDEAIPIVTPDALESLPSFRAARRAERADLNTQAAILFTSGTTGKPKGCVLSNGYFQAWGRRYAGLGGLAALRPGTERLLTPLPTNHVNALACSFMGMLYSGGCIIQLDRFHSSTWWETVRESRATIIHYLGVMPAMLLNLPAASDEDFSSQIRFGLGAGVDPKHHAAFERRFGFPLLEGWAMTETGGVACIMAHEEPRHIDSQAIGRPPSEIEVRLVDENGVDVAPGDSGEMLLRSSGANPRLNFFSGYYKDEAATAEVWEGGYFHTGDLVRRDEDGCLFFVDRRKNIVRRSGENIAAAEVEAVLLEQRAVAACAISAVPDTIRGEEVMAMIIPAEGYEPNEALANKIVQACLKSMSYFKVPGHIGFVESLPVGATQKIKQGEVRLLCEQVLDTDAHHDTRHLKRRQTRTAG